MLVHLEAQDDLMDLDPDSMEDYMENLEDSEHFHDRVAPDVLSTQTIFFANFMHPLTPDNRKNR